MPENFKSRLVRFGYNIYPSYAATGVKVTYVAADYREVRLKIPLNWRTRNPFGSIFGGSLYGCLDPVYTMMLLHIFGRKNVVVWTKSASIDFIKPGYSDAFAKFVVSAEDVENIRRQLLEDQKVYKDFSISLFAKDGTEITRVDQVVYIRKREEA